MPKTLVFLGTLISGMGRYSELEFPAKHQLQDPPQDWPDTFSPGSLNILIRDDGYPPGYELSKGGTRQLDSGSFPPAYCVPGPMIKNNKLLRDGDSSAGSAQAWRAEMSVENGPTFSCWVVRRIGSNVGRGRSGNVLEVMSDRKLRVDYGLTDGERVTVTLQIG